METQRKQWWLSLMLVVVLTCVTRFYKVEEPDHVCWDETHFGKMGSWYINRTFFFDVHPPLGKMLIGLSGYLSGYNGSYPFEKPGDKYNGTNYLGMRYFCTTLGALVLPMAFDTIHDLTNSNQAGLIAASYLMFDIGLITLNQYILLDPILLFFIFASVWGMVKLRKFTSSYDSYGIKWWFWLFFTGTMLSCSISVKFVGLFVVLLVGMHTATDLWNILGDSNLSIKEAIKQLMCRAFALILWPIVLYFIFFYAHLHVLNKSGNGDGFYSSAFQSTLKGNSLHNISMPRYIAFGSVVTLKNHKTGGGYLHSHLHLYPKGYGAKQQQITSYTHKDENNKWVIKPHNESIPSNLKFLKNGDLLRLEHVATQRNLHSHSDRAPITKKHYQVTGYGEKGLGDVNDIWKVVAVGTKTDLIATVKSKFILVHLLQNCVLVASGKQLPKWGYDQQEVSCNPNLRDKNGIWNIEENRNNQLQSVNFSVYAPGFFEKFMESHAVMFQGNAGLKPKEGEITSRPWQWPINYKGQFFSGSPYRIYLLGNPIIWWSNLIFLFSFLIMFIYVTIKKRRTKGEVAFVLMTKANGMLELLKKNSSYETTLPVESMIWLFLGWALHYIPFWCMGRVLYFHHYFPALIFNSMLAGISTNFFLSILPQSVRHIIFGLLLSGLVYSFQIFSPLAYGMKGNEVNSTLSKLKWLESWEF